MVMRGCVAFLWVLGGMVGCVLFKQEASEKIY